MEQQYKLVKESFDYKIKHLKKAKEVAQEIILSAPSPIFFVLDDSGILSHHTIDKNKIQMLEKLLSIKFSKGVGGSYFSLYKNILIVFG